MLPSRRTAGERVARLLEQVSSVVHLLDRVPGWDSVLLLSLLTALEREWGQPICLPDMLTATSFRDIYRVAVRT